MKKNLFPLLRSNLDNLVKMEKRFIWQQDKAEIESPIFSTTSKMKFLSEVNSKNTRMILNHLIQETMVEIKEGMISIEHQEME